MIKIEESLKEKLEKTSSMFQYAPHVNGKTKKHSQKENQTKAKKLKVSRKAAFKVARYSFSGSIPPKFEHKLHRHKESFGRIAITVVY